MLGWVNSPLLVCVCVCVIKALMHHQYRLNNLERLYGAQEYTYSYKA